MALFAVTTLAACRSEDALRASADTVESNLMAYAMTGTPIQFPSALNTIAQTTVPINGVGTWDVAFDFDLATPDQIKVMPIRQIITPFSPLIPSVGLAAFEQDYDDLTAAPETYYRPDTTLIVQPGETFVVQTFRSSGVLICAYLLTPRVYTKVVIDSVNPSTRAVYLRQTLNPNCGYRSFLPGRPSN